MNALACLAEAFAWLIRPGIRRFILLPLAVNITLFAAGSYHCPAHSHLLQLQPDGEPHRRTV